MNVRNEQEIYRPGENFRFTYELDGFDTNFTFLGIYLIYRERVEYHDGNETMVKDFERPIQQFILKNQHLGAAENPVIDQIFQIPNREMGIRNPYMYLYDARLKATSWHIRVIIDPQKKSYRYSDLQLKVEGEITADEPENDQSDLYDVFLVEHTTWWNIKHTLGIATLFPHMNTAHNIYHYLPALVRERVSREEAEQFKADLEAAGAIAAVRPMGVGYGVPEPGLYDGEPCAEVVAGEMKLLEAPEAARYGPNLRFALLGAIISVLAVLMWWSLLGFDIPRVMEFPGAAIFLVLAIGVVLLGTGVGNLWTLHDINKITALVSEKRLQAGDSFRFIYQKELARKTDVQWLEIWLVYREKVSYNKGGKSAHYDRLVQKFSYDAHHYEKGELLREEVVFQIPNREMDIRNLYMNMPDAKVTGTEWLVRVTFDAGGSHLAKSEYKLDVQ